MSFRGKEPKGNALEFLLHPWHLASWASTAQCTWADSDSLALALGGLVSQFCPDSSSGPHPSLQLRLSGPPRAQGRLTLQASAHWHFLCRTPLPGHHKHLPAFSPTSPRDRGSLCFQHLTPRRPLQALTSRTVLQATGSQEPPKLWPRTANSQPEKDLHTCPDPRPAVVQGG